MGNDNLHSLLDRFVVSREWDNLFNSSKVNRSERITSYHFPIVLDAGDIIWVLKHSDSNSWLEDKECIQLIKSKLSEDSSHGWAGFVIFAKLRNLKLSLKQGSSQSEKKHEVREEQIVSEISTLDAKDEFDGISLDEVERRCPLKSYSSLHMRKE